MTGVSLSRWTLIYFVTALLSLIVAEALMVLGFGYPAAGIGDPETLVLVHLLAIGWLSLLMLGAMFQFVPVLVAAPLRHPELQLPAWALLVAGLLALLAGFLQLSGALDFLPLMLPIGATLLFMGFVTAAISLIATLFASMPLGLPARFVLLGLGGLAAVATLGWLFAGTLSGLLQHPFFGALVGNSVPFHAALGLGAWLSISAMGVTHRLVPMFLLAPDKARETGYFTWWASLIAAVSLAVGAFVAPGKPIFASIMAVIAVIMALGALAAYGADILHYYRSRARKIIEPNSRMAAWAISTFAASGILVAGLLVAGRLGAFVAPVVYLVAMGWLSGLGLSQLVKIVPFVTWLECYGTVLGKMPTPRVQDLVVEMRLLRLLATYFISVFAGAGALALGWPLVFRLAVAVTLGATLLIGRELYRVRRLKDVPDDKRRLAPVPLPRLVFASSQRPST
ncbi:MAG TPA: hypothetical protein VIL84_09060 [Devosiaceae bacterium]